jgi:AcrR family transcriptional regulator
MGKRKAEARPLRAEDWAEAALEALVEGGIGSVAVEPLARRLGVTKGSFYWHFRGRPALLEAAIARWEARDTEGVIAAISALPDPRARLLRLFADVTRMPQSRSAYLALAEASTHPLVRAALERVSERRIGYLEQCYRELGMPPGEARNRALLAYATYAGFLHLTRTARSSLPSERGLEAYRRHVIATLVPAER